MRSSKLWVSVVLRLPILRWASLSFRSLKLVAPAILPSQPSEQLIARKHDLGISSDEIRSVTRREAVGVRDGEVDAGDRGRMAYLCTQHLTERQEPQAGDTESAFEHWSLWHLWQACY